MESLLRTRLYNTFIPVEINLFPILISPFMSRPSYDVCKERKKILIMSILQLENRREIILIYK